MIHRDSQCAVRLDHTDHAWASYWELEERTVMTWPSLSVHFVETDALCAILQSALNRNGASRFPRLSTLCTLQHGLDVLSIEKARDG